MTIRNIDEQLKARLRVQAAKHGRSMEDGGTGYFTHSPFIRSGARIKHGQVHSQPY